MKVVTSLADADVSQQPSVVSIGNFDGLHLGHREILATVVARARELGLRSVAMTFTPHPIRFLAPDRAPRMISTLDQKVRLIQETGIDVLFIATFDLPFSRLSPEEFVEQYLIRGLHARWVCVGGNFNFGYKQRGSIETLRQFKSQGRTVSPNKSPSYAPALFTEHPDAKKTKPKLTSKDFADAMERLFHSGKIKVVSEGPPSRQRDLVTEVEG